jgi:hypothetical protein
MHHSRARDTCCAACQSCFKWHCQLSNTIRCSLPDHERVRIAVSRLTPADDTRLLQQPTWPGSVSILSYIAMSTCKQHARGAQ